MKKRNAEKGNAGQVLLLIAMLIVLLALCAGRLKKGETVCFPVFSDAAGRLDECLNQSESVYQAAGNFLHGIFRHATLF